jgi:hypothetical protein
MFGILGEDESDFKTLKVLVRRLVGQSTKVQGGGYDGCDELLRRGANDIRGMWQAGDARHFIVCHDADGRDPTQTKQKVMERVVQKSGLNESCCIVVPTEEIEAWILADLDAVRRLMRKFPQRAEIKSPECVCKPKEYLEHISADSRGKKLYDHSRHNEKVAMRLDLAIVRKKCPSYGPFEDFVKNRRPR